MSIITNLIDPSVNYTSCPDFKVGDKYIHKNSGEIGTVSSIEDDFIFLELLGRIEKIEKDSFTTTVTWYETIPPLWALIEPSTKVISTVSVSFFEHYQTTYMPKNSHILKVYREYGVLSFLILHENDSELEAKSICLVQLGYYPATLPIKGRRYKFIDVIDGLAVFVDFGSSGGAIFYGIGT